jgi:hypothetical protein
MKFDYKVVNISNTKFEDTHIFSETLKRYGEKGWELVSAVAHSHLGSSKYSLIGFSQKNTLIFKKRLDDQEEA